MTKAFRSDPALGRVLLAFACVYLIWGSTYLAIRVAIETMPPFFMAGVRYLIAGGLMYGFLRLRGEPAPAASGWRAATIVGGFLLLGGNGGVVWAEQSVPSGIAALIISTVPLWIVLLQWVWLGVRPTRRAVFGILLGFFGVAVLIGPDLFSTTTGRIDPIGVLVLLFSSLLWSIGSLYARHANMAPSPLLATGMEMIGGGVLLAFVSLALGEPGRVHVEKISFDSFAALAYLILFGAIVGFGAYTWLLKNVSPTRVATYAYVNPVVAVFLGWAIKGEVLSPRTLGAAAIIVASVALTSILQSVARPGSSAEEQIPLTGVEEPPA